MKTLIALDDGESDENPRGPGLRVSTVNMQSKRNAARKSMAPAVGDIKPRHPGDADRRLRGLAGPPPRQIEKVQHLYMQEADRFPSLITNYGAWEFYHRHRQLYQANVQRIRKPAPAFRGHIGGKELAYPITWPFFHLSPFEMCRRSHRRNLTEGFHECAARWTCPPPSPLK